MERPPLDYNSEGAYQCFNMFHSQLCHGFGAPEFCPACGESWTHNGRRLAERGIDPALPNAEDPPADPHGGYLGE